MSAETYEVVTRGIPGPAVLNAMGGFEVASVERGLSHLVGQIPDQDRMQQVLEVLRDLNIELVSINQVTEQRYNGDSVGTEAAYLLPGVHSDP